MGSVRFVGAGPGDRGLITVRGITLLSGADVVVLDRVASPIHLQHCRAEVEIVDGLRDDKGHDLTYAQRARLLVKHAKAGAHHVQDRGQRATAQDAPGIAGALQLRPGEHVVEIGPGRGALTDELVHRAGPLSAIEIDKDLCALLRLRYAGKEHLRILEGDVLDMDFGDKTSERQPREGQRGTIDSASSRAVS